MNLTPSQSTALNEILKFLDSKTENEIIISGSPGYGKSFLVNTIAKYADLDITATTNKAADIIDGRTIFSYLGLIMKDDLSSGICKIDYKNAKIVFKRNIVIDECSMINQEVYNAIKTYTRNCKIIYVGDFYQLPPVNDSFSIFNLGIRILELKEPCRTNHMDLLNLCSTIKQNIISKTIFKNYKPSDNVKFLLSDESKNKILSTFVPARDKILTFTNDAVLSSNSYMRKLFNKQPLFGTDDYFVCKSAVNTNVGLSKVESIKQIKKLHKVFDDKSAIIETVDGMIFNVFLDQGLYKNEISKLADNALAIKDPNLRKAAWRKYFEFKNNVLDIRDIYASTVHSAQGSTYENVFIDIKNIYNIAKRSDLMRLMYVAISRAKEKVYIISGL